MEIRFLTAIVVVFCVITSKPSLRTIKSIIWKITTKLRPALFRVIMQQVVVISYRRFGTTYRVPSSRVKNPKKKSGRHSTRVIYARVAFFFKFCALEMRLISSSETSVLDYRHSLCNNTEERSSYLPGQLESKIKDQQIYPWIRRLEVSFDSSLPSAVKKAGNLLPVSRPYWTFGLLATGNKSLGLSAWNLLRT